MQKKFKFFLTISSLLIGLVCIAMPASAVQLKPPTSTSWYVYVTADESDATLNNWMWYKGYEQGQRDLQSTAASVSTVILDFGQPWVQSGIQGVVGFPFDSINSNRSKFLSNTQIYSAAQYFASGYYYGSNNSSKILRLAIGTNNKNSGSTVTYAHGQAWAQMVNKLNSWIKNTVANNKIFFYGANDIEPEYSTSSAALNWVNGYTSTWAAPSYLLNYGSTEGCPKSGTTATPGPCNNGWNQESIWHVSWGAAPAYPFPEIYNTLGVQAKHWQQLSLYSYLAHGGRMNIVGPLSQRVACAQRGGCAGIDNTPDAAWSQLWNALNGDTRTVQNMSFSSDIAWRK